MKQNDIIIGCLLHTRKHHLERLNAQFHRLVSNDLSMVDAYHHMIIHESYRMLKDFPYAKNNNDVSVQVRLT